ncbi:MAG: hypothetical protein MZU97_07165 [Bacillus subtilis]|nr:hypothetical protein [Bacillus subtilis]
MATSLAPVAASSRSPQTSTIVSSSEAFAIFLTARHSDVASDSLGLSECMILGSVVRQAITRTRSEISRENTVSVCVSQRSNPRKPRRTTQLTSSPEATASLMGCTWFCEQDASRSPRMTGMSLP